MNNILFIDTCNSRLVLSLIIENKIIDILYFKSNKNMSEIFTNQIDIFLKKKNFDKKNVNKINVLNGPGSFGGIKVGLVFTNLFVPLNNSKRYYPDVWSFQQPHVLAPQTIDATRKLNSYRSHDVLWAKEL